ncbi:MAG: hypothetical protein ACLT2F_08490 [Butyricicoccus sp.]
MSSGSPRGSRNSRRGGKGSAKGGTGGCLFGAVTSRKSLRVEQQYGLNEAEDVLEADQDGAPRKGKAVSDIAGGFCAVVEA